jgi:hypothetical protein
MLVMKRSLNIMLLSLLTIGLVLQLAGQAFFFGASVQPVLASVQTVSPCHQQVSASSHVDRLCQSGKHVENPTLLSAMTFLVSMSAAKLYFIFILGLITLSHQRRIDKPPKNLFCYP